jgi:hypothetical protein
MPYACSRALYVCTFVDNKRSVGISGITCLNHGLIIMIGAWELSLVADCMRGQACFRPARMTVQKVLNKLRIPGTVLLREAFYKYVFSCVADSQCFDSNPYMTC